MSGRDGSAADDPALEEELVLSELVSRVLDRGVMIAGEVTISVAGIDLIELGLHLYLTSSETARGTDVGVFPRRAGLPERPPGSAEAPSPGPSEADPTGRDDA